MLDFPDHGSAFSCLADSTNKEPVQHLLSPLLKPQPNAWSDILNGVETEIFIAFLEVGQDVEIAISREAHVNQLSGIGNVT